MSRTNISTEKQEIAVQREGTLTWIGALILEVIMCMVAYYIADLIGEGASFWHHKVGLFDYAGRAAKWFGFRKTWGNFALAVVYETLALRLFIKCLGVEFSTDSKDSASRRKHYGDWNNRAPRRIYCNRVFQTFFIVLRLFL